MTLSALCFLWNISNLSLLENTANPACSPARLNVLEGAMKVMVSAPISSFAFPIGMCVFPGCVRSACISSEITSLFRFFASSRTNSRSSLSKTSPEGLWGEQKSTAAASSSADLKLSLSRENVPSPFFLRGTSSMILSLSWQISLKGLYVGLGTRILSPLSVKRSMANATPCRSPFTNTLRLSSIFQSCLFSVHDENMLVTGSSRGYPKTPSAASFSAVFLMCGSVL